MSAVASETMQARQIKWRTQDVHPSSRLSDWNRVASSTFTPMSISAEDRSNFGAELGAVCSGQTTIARIKSAGSTVSHDQQDAQADLSDPAYILHLQIKGCSENIQAGRSVVLQPGDCTLVDSKRPYQLSFGVGAEFIVCRFSAKNLRSYLPFPDDGVSRLISHRSGSTRTLQGLLQQIWIEAWEEEPGDWLNEADSCILPLLALAWRSSGLPSCRAQPSGLRQRVEQYVANHFEDPDLNIASIANAMSTSTRWIQKAFAVEGETPVQYIQRIRVENASQMLLTDKCSITEVAFASGFNDITHFGRVFKRHFSQSPSRFRASKQANPTRFALMRA